MRILSIAAHGPDASAVLVEGGRVVAAAREESFSRIRRDRAFPRRAVRYCLNRAGLRHADLDLVVVPEKPLRRFERVLAREILGFPRTARSFAREMFRWLGGRLWLKNEVASEIGVDASRVRFVERHVALGTAAVELCPWSEAAVLSADAEGEWSTLSVMAVKGGDVEVVREVHHPHALSRMSAALAAHAGIHGPDGASRWLSLAAYGRPGRAPGVSRLIEVRDGGFRLDLDALGRTGEPGAPIEESLIGLLGPPRGPGQPLRMEGSDTRDADIARAGLDRLAEVACALAREALSLTSLPRLCLAGDFADAPPLSARVVLEPGPGRALPAALGGAPAAALGAGLFVARVEGDEPAPLRPRLDYGPAAAGHRAAPADPPPDDAIERAAGILAGGDLLGWVRGDLEFSRHTLGGRSLFSHPGRGEDVNRALKRREPWLPHGSAVLAERAAEWFEIPEGCEVALRRRSLPVPVAADRRGLVPAIAHADGTALVRVVSESEDPAVHRLLRTFFERTGLPVLLETTLRRPGEPMVRDLAEARRLLERSDVGWLVAGDRLVRAGEDRW